MHPETDQPWEVEHGSFGGDEVNLIRAGANYGWPVITNGLKNAAESNDIAVGPDGAIYPVLNNPGTILRLAPQ